VLAGVPEDDGVAEHPLKMRINMDMKEMDNISKRGFDLLITFSSFGSVTFRYMPHFSKIKIKRPSFIESCLPVAK